MADRTDIATVRAILPTGTALTDPQIQAAIDTATLMVDELVADGCLDWASDAMLKRIETYLAAHFAANTEFMLAAQSEDDACCDGSVTYGFKLGEGIKGSPFGITANMLSKGCLQEYDKRPAMIYSLGSIVE